MSYQQVIEFVTQVQRNPALLDEVLRVGGGLADILFIAQREGFVFNAEDWNMTMMNIIGSASEALSDDDLELIAGGNTATTYLTNDGQCTLLCDFPDTLAC